MLNDVPLFGKNIYFFISEQLISALSATATVAHSEKTLLKPAALAKQLFIKDCNSDSNMRFLVRTARTIRNHWKKSTFAAGLVVYGISSGKNYIDTQTLMRDYCQKAACYGNKTIPVHISPRSITIILNPNANKRKSLDEFEKYCAPLLHLAGISVEIIKTESEGHAKVLMENVGGTDAIVVAGGDGTLSEVVTGLLRRTNENTASLVPLGILPLGRSNTVAKNLFPTEKKLNKVRFLADATMAVIEEMTKPIDVMRIEVVDENVVRKPIYAVAGIKWGAYRDAEAKIDSYWYFGTLRKYATYIFNGLKSSLSQNRQAVLNYSAPCEGCSNCKNRHVSDTKSGWFQRLIKENRSQDKYFGVYNPECQITHEKNVSTIDLALLTSNAIPSSFGMSKGIPKLEVRIGPEELSYIDFVKNGWMSEQGKSRDVKEVYEARTIEIKPEQKTQSWFSIDNEYYEAKPIKVTLLPEAVNMFCKKESREPRYITLTYT
ncbi:hypothetical protein NQ315_014184 [Exocentrus adspersus]|uniref:Acylglycerol kinase, mitochondrial n=1 Tax=Exocentrus adspersus TaxID=1586481 RepID=A0AAV8VB06_9CUCU|nr:hypothetical protein NQ315_014184 [Exocentrus adspersus]